MVKNKSTSVAPKIDISPQELARLNALERYRQLRENMWNQYVQRRKTPKAALIARPKKAANKNAISAPRVEDGLKVEETTPGDEITEIPLETGETQEEKPAQPKISDEKLAERTIVSEQLISYQCIKKRLNEEGCLELTNLMRESCPLDVVYPDPVDCLKKNLKQLR